MNFSSFTDQSSKSSKFLNKRAAFDNPPSGASEQTPTPPPALEKKRSRLVDEFKSFAWIILILLCARAFILEPYKIPTGSMIPTLLVGDYISVTKFSYSIGIPFTKIKLFHTGTPKRGDVAIFLYPNDENVGLWRQIFPMNYVKRIIGLPGDTIEIRNRNVMVNGVAMITEEIEPREHLALVEEVSKHPFQRLFWEKFPLSEEAFSAENTVTTPYYMMLDDINRSPLTQFMAPIVVPEGHYFVMGDNRDQSSDSRNWGFVPQENLKGKAAFVWMSFHPDYGLLNIANSVRWKRLFSWVK